MVTRKKIAFHTFGCKLNFAETSTIARDLSLEDYEVTDAGDHADIYVIHSCAVTAAAEKKCHQFIRHLKRENPESSIIVMGCYAQLNPQKLKAMPELDLVLGNTEKFALARHIKELASRGISHAGKHEDTSGQTFIPSYSIGDRTRSFLKIQDGCDYFCSYCTVPLARGRSRSASIKDIIHESQKIADAGIKEIVLTGVNIGDFGKLNMETFYDLLLEMEQNVPIPRIRISSIEPDLLDDRIIDLVSGSVKMMPHFHIPLQSGSNRILKAMKRRYSSELFVERVKRIKELMFHCCVAADVITGFPGETDDDFAETCHFVEGLDISYLHVFTFSERSGTLASRMEGKVPPEKKKERSQHLHLLSERKKQKFYHQNKGKTCHVLFESDPQKSDLFGFTENYIQVKTSYSQKLINQIVPVCLNEMDVKGIYIMKNEK